MPTHESYDRKHAVATSSDRSFGLAFAALFAVIASFRILHGHAHAVWWLGVAGLFSLLAFCKTAPLAPLNRVWERDGQLLQSIVNPVLMGLISLAAIVPTGGVDAMRGSCLGPVDGNTAITSRLGQCGARFTQLAAAELIDPAAADLAAGRYLAGLRGA